MVLKYLRKLGRVGRQLNRQRRRWINQRPENFRLRCFRASLRPTKKKNWSRKIRNKSATQPGENQYFLLILNEIQIFKYFSNVTIAVRLLDRPLMSVPPEYDSTVSYHFPSIRRYFCGPPVPVG